MRAGRLRYFAGRLLLLGVVLLLGGLLPLFRVVLFGVESSAADWEGCARVGLLGAGVWFSGIVLMVVEDWGL